MSSTNAVPTCYELTILVPEVQKEIITLLLNDLGEHEFVEGYVDCDIEFDHNSATFKKDFYSELATLSPIVLYSEDLSRLQNVKEGVIAKAPDYSVNLPEAAVRLCPIADQNWRESWKASFKPVLVSTEFALIPPWEANNVFLQKHKIVIDPGMAFGTGQHETTRVCLQIFCELKEKYSLAPQRLLDVGTGSGVLAIAASLTGVPFVFANDIDSPSIDIARVNAQVNNQEKIVFTDKLLHEFSEREFDFIFANIQFKPLSKLMPEILLKASPNAFLVISGILVSEKSEFCEFLEGLNVRVIETKDLGHWTGIVCKVNK